MRALRLFKLPAPRHDSSLCLTVALCSLSSTSHAAAAESLPSSSSSPTPPPFTSPFYAAGSPATASIDSSVHTTVPMHALLRARLSRRQMRQREQRWGSLWRYRTDQSPPSIVAQAQSLLEVSKAREGCKVDLGVAPAAGSAVTTGGAQDVAVTGIRNGAGLSAALPGSMTRTSAAPHLDVEGKHTTKKGEKKSGRRVFGTDVYTTAAHDAPSHEPTEDPLLAFLETHQEDAAELLAMWTALHRSCVYGSELSEAVVLQVRYFLHSLLRSRAIAAAVDFYYRLMGLGVQLQQSDLLLLLSSLPYEHATVSEAAQLTRAKEEAALDKDRQLWTRRRAEFKDAAAQPRAATTVASEPPSAPVEAEGRELHVAKSTPLPGSSPPSDNAATSCPSSSVEVPMGVSEARPPSTIARGVAFHQQPEWVKRWILYEASMGTLDALDTSPDFDTRQTPKWPTGLGVEDDDTASASCITDNASDTATAAVAIESERASRLMEVSAIVDHLHLLVLGTMKSEGSSTLKGAKSTPYRRRGRTAATASTSATTGFGAALTSGRESTRAARHYWKEAVLVVRQAYAAPLWASPVTGESTAGDVDRHEGDHPEMPLLLPTALAASLQSMVREVQSWEGGLVLLQLRTPKPSSAAIDLTPEGLRDGAILFLSLAAVAQPWKTQATVETWMHQKLLPRLFVSSDAHSVPAITAVRVLWLSHLCAVKASRPDDFTMIAEEALQYLPLRPVSAHWGTTAELLRHADLAAMMTEVSATAERATQQFLREVQQSLRDRRATEVLATSIRTGAYHPSLLEDDQNNKGSTADVTHSSPSSPSASIVLPTAALLSDNSVDAFVLCCAAVKEAVWLRVTTAALQDHTTVMAEVLQLLERSLYGPSGLYSALGSLFGVTSIPPQEGRDSSSRSDLFFVSPDVALAAPERAFVCCVLASTLLQLVRLLCHSAASQQRFGTQTHNRATMGLLLELAFRALDAVPVSSVRQSPWRWACEMRVAELAASTAKTLRAVVKTLDVHPKNERVVFGAMPERELQLLTNMARLLLKTTELAAARQKCPSPWRTLNAISSPRVLLGTLLCFRRSSALGKRVRHHLTRHENERLDTLLLGGSGEPRGLRRGAIVSGVSSAARRKQTLDRGLLPQKRVTDRDFGTLLVQRDAVYTAVQTTRTAAELRATLQQLAANTSSWKASLMLCHVVTKDMALARGTCDVNFFATILTGVSSDLVDDAASGRGKRGRGSNAPKGKEPVGPSSLWLNALDVFWSAVDHVVVVPHSEEQNLRETPSAAHHGHSLSPEVAQERAVLAKLLLPLIQFSCTVRRRDLGQNWRRSWVAKHTAAERLSPAFRHQNITALAALGDPAALNQCVASYDVLGRDEMLLCDVATKHQDWQRALTAVLEVCGSIEEKEKDQTCYSLPVARTVLRLLARSPKNLSNTAMRLAALQQRQEESAWDVDCGAWVIRLLLASRRWSQALRLVEQALHRPAMQDVEAAIMAPRDCTDILTGQTLSAATVLPYATLMTLGVQATAIGGSSEHAPRYYDAVKAAVHAVFPSFSNAVDDRTDSTGDAPLPSSSSHASTEDGEDFGLGAVFAMAETTALPLADADMDGLDAEEKQCRAELMELSGRARLLFFRAMTKKLMSSKSFSGGHDDPGDADTYGAGSADAFYTHEGRS